MTTSGPPSNRPKEEPRAGNLARAKGALAIEAFALAVALVTPITPSKTGSTWSPGEFFSRDPSYLEDVAASFLMVNGLLLVIGLAVWITARFGASE
jgi:hypothetical protein